MPCHLTVKQISSTKTFPGPVDQDYLKSDVFGVESTVWSPCGAEGMLNINSAISVTPLNDQQSALMTVSNILESITPRRWWRSCKMCVKDASG